MFVPLLVDIPEVFFVCQSLRLALLVYVDHLGRPDEIVDGTGAAVGGIMHNQKIKAVLVVDESIERGHFCSSPVFVRPSLN